jgi:lipopolysaccharide/colanic/teichoic acid biosynthesis glycosyltransferase
MQNNGHDSFNPEKPHSLYLAFHDATSYFFSLIGILFFFLPLFPVFALAIKFDSSGPIFYKQLRTGRHGHPFTLLKFRTMKDKSDTHGSKWTLKGDDRITRVGKFLRKYRLDELPQLINILKGEMALIGPRPEAVELVEEFKKEIPFYDCRYSVLPGITGWAQVNHENTCSVDGAYEKLQYDLYWIKHRSFALDIKIIFKSIKVIFTGYGAV